MCIKDSSTEALIAPELEVGDGHTEGMDSHFQSHLSRRRQLERLVFASQSVQADQDAERNAEGDDPQGDEDNQGRGLRWSWRWRTARVFIAICLLLALIAGAVNNWNSRLEEDDLSASDAESPSAHANSTGSISSSSPGIQQSGEEGSASSGQVMVHMTGEVRVPGVVRVKHGSRVSEAVDQAGGFTEDADRDSVNLARLVVDGEQIRVPSLNSAKAQDEAPSGQASACIDVTQADVQTLQGLDGVGPALAARIVTYRKSHPITRVDDLVAVPGIGASILEKIRIGACS